MANDTPTNRDIAQVLSRIADLLELQDANPFRVRAYRLGARTAREAAEPLAGMVRRGDGDALRHLPYIGEKQARLIEEYVLTGRAPMLDRLVGEMAPEVIFAKVPGIGPELAQRVARELEIDSLEELEQAAYDGRLARVRGFGPHRIQAVRLSLAGMLNRSAQRRGQELRAAHRGEPPSVSALLKVDAEYRTRAEAGELKRIAPRRFNPSGEAWLPIMHAEFGPWLFTALYSNTARAHELDKTHDWVVIYAERDGEEFQYTVVTETGGPLKGRRVVRGREAESRAYYAQVEV